MMLMTMPGRRLHLQLTVCDDDDFVDDDDDDDSDDDDLYIIGAVCIM